MCGGEEEQGEALTHLRCVLIPGGLGFTVRERKEGEKDNLMEDVEVMAKVEK